jgi:LysM repeat protein
MSPSKKRTHFMLQLGYLAAVLAVAGCSTNQSSSSAIPAPTTQTGSAAAAASLEPAAERGTQTYRQQPVLQRVSDPVPLAPDAPNEYTVQVGDTLWDIASTFLKDPWYWPEVWFINPQVENPHLIYPGDVLALVTIDGQQRITNVRASTYRMSPQARITPLTESITSIPYEQIAAFLSKGLVLEKGQIEQLPYILAVRGDHMVAAAGNEIYVRGSEGFQTGTRFSVVTIGDALTDPDDGKVIGFQGIHVGEGAVSRSGDPATVALTDTNREANEGDRLVPETVEIPLNFFPKAPEIEVDGRIISVVDGVALIGQYQVVVMNRGARNGLAPGDVLTVFQAGAEIRDRYTGSAMYSSKSLFGGKKVTLPDEEAGTIMVFKVYDRIAYGLVMEATSEIRIHDAVRNPS